MKKTIMLPVFLLFIAALGAADADFTTLNDPRIRRGATAQITEGPFGLKALSFDGSADAVSSLGITDPEAVQFTVAFWVRFDSVLEENDTGLGVYLNPAVWRLQWQLPTVSDRKIAARSVRHLDPGEWCYVVYTCDIRKDRAELYMNGIWEHTLDGVFPVKQDFTAIGRFHGALAGIRLWDRVLTPEEINSFAVTPETLRAVKSRLNAVKAEGPGLTRFLSGLKEKAEKLSSQPKAAVSELTDLERKVRIAEQLQKSDAAMRGTGLADAPFALMQVKACSTILRQPEKFPPDPVYTDVMRVAAAKGEYEPFSFIVHGYEPVGKLKFTASDFHSENGKTLPASILDGKIVKCWFQSNWHTYFKNTFGLLLPDLLLNDEELVRVDEVNRKNYLRFSYPDKTVYNCVNDVPERGVDPSGFNFLLEPVRDAPVLQSVRLTPGRGTQFWYTVHVPEDAEEGVYFSDVKATADGKDAGTFRIRLRVYPFTLPEPKTKFDPEKPYLGHLIRSAELMRYMELTQDQEEAERILKLDLANIKAHGFQWVGTAPYSSEPWRKKIFLRDLELHKEAGIGMTPFMGGFGASMKLYNLCSSPGGTNNITQEVYDSEMSSFREFLDRDVEEQAKALGHRNIWFYSYDETQSSAGLLLLSNHRIELLKRGYTTYTTGWDANYKKLPAFEQAHATATYPNARDGENWQAIGGCLLSYAQPFAGPDDPELMRRHHGLELYLLGFSGFSCLDYASGTHLWNSNANKSEYTNMLVAYPTGAGPVNSIAFEGVREGLDDVRYATLLQQEIRRAFASGSPERIRAAKRAALFLEDLRPDRIDPDRVRQAAAGHIIHLMKLAKTQKEQL